MSARPHDWVAKLTDAELTECLGHRPCLQGQALLVGGRLSVDHVKCGWCRAVTHEADRREFAGGIYP